MEKYKIAVYKVEKIENCLYPKKTLIKYIYRKIWAEMLGNFNPIFCRYNKDNRCLVKSFAGDISDFFRREDNYFETLYIEIE